MIIRIIPEEECSFFLELRSLEILQAIEPCPRAFRELLSLKGTYVVALLVLDVIEIETDGVENELGTGLVTFRVYPIVYVLHYLYWYAQIDHSRAFVRGGGATFIIGHVQIPSPILAN